MNQGIFILIVTFLIYCILGSHCVVFSNSINNDEFFDKLNNIPTTDDVDEASSLSSEFKSRYSATQGKTIRKDLVYYVDPKRNSITFIFYYLIDKNVQDLVCKIINDIRIERQLTKKILIQFYRNEHIVQDPNNPRVQRREDEELLRSRTLEGK